jgi:AdoMet-dependent rRNA methyltransferase SPB1
MERRRRRLKKEKSKEEWKKEASKDEDPNKGEFEVVTKKTLDDYNIDDLAYNRALSKKMMRTNIRDTIIERSFSRNTIEEDNLPKWFMDDEMKHQYKIDPITKEEFAAEREKLMAINSKVPKKVQY